MSIADILDAGILRVDDQEANVPLPEQTPGEAGVFDGLGALSVRAHARRGS